ncbi:MAG: hypothetical protein QF735_13705, partial [Phycisphaeraceae bacterium]|nr:hypothetical protein [Phycisphaeraceae bacterium]
MAQRSNPLPVISDFIVNAALSDAFREDLGDAGDITSLTVVPKEVCTTVDLVVRQDGCIAGLEVACAAF